MGERRRGSTGSARAGPGEAYRILRTNLLVALSEVERPVVMFTSAYAGEGKTSTVSHLAPLMALAGQRVVLVDLDLRHPGIHSAFGVPQQPGIVEVLRGEAALEECLRHVPVGSDEERGLRGLRVLTAGAIPPNPAELLATHRPAELFKLLSDDADVVLVDAAPVLPVADSLVLARIVSGVVLVVEARRTPLPSVQQAKDALTRNHARLLGVIVSKMQRRDVAGSLYHASATHDVPGAGPLYGPVTNGSSDQLASDGPPPERPLRARRRVPRQ